jgi:GPH family glycoside/pentoside/hexuronide:cation symporter
MTAVAGLLSVLAVVCYLLCYFMVTERVNVPAAPQQAKPGQLVHTVLHNRALLAVILAAVLLLFSQLTTTTMNNYVFPNYYGSVWAISLMSLLGSVASLAVCAPLAVPLSRKFGRKELGTAACLASAAAYAAVFFLRPASVWGFLAFGVLAHIGMGFFNMVIWAYITDVIDDTQLRLGRREDGTIYSVYSFARKLGQAAASGLTGLLLGWVGYSTETAFDPPVLQGIFNIASAVPAAGFLLTGLVLLFLYPLNKNRVEENAARLRALRMPPDGIDPMG